VSFFSDTYDHACILVDSALLTVEKLSYFTSCTLVVTLEWIFFAFINEGLRDLILPYKLFVQQYSIPFMEVVRDNGVSNDVMITSSLRIDVITLEKINYLYS